MKVVTVVGPPAIVVVIVQGHATGEIDLDHIHQKVPEKTIQDHDREAGAVVVIKTIVDVEPAVHAQEIKILKIETSKTVQNHDPTSVMDRTNMKIKIMMMTIIMVETIMKTAIKMSNMKRLAIVEDFNPIRKMKTKMMKKPQN